MTPWKENADDKFEGRRTVIKEILIDVDGCGWLKSARVIDENEETEGWRKSAD